jgi:hypothetical protein
LEGLIGDCKALGDKCEMGILKKKEGKERRG